MAAGSDDAPQGDPWRVLKQRLEGRLARPAQRLAVAWQGRPKRRTAAVPADFTALVVGKPASPAALLGALEFALSEGAPQSALSLATRLEPLSAGLPSGLGTRARLALIDVALLHGKTAQAKEQASAAKTALGSNDRGATLLELLELREARLLLPSGKLNLLAVSRPGACSPLDLASALRHSPLLPLKQPDLTLAVFSQLVRSQPEGARSFLNLYLCSHGLAPCVEIDAERSSGAPGSLRFAPVAASRSRRKVSVVVAARNAAATLATSNDSLLSQSHAALEILVGDDASDDATPELLLRRYGRQPQVRLFQSPRPQGAYNLRNALAAQASGELLTFHDADDLALPQRIELQLKALERRGALACVADLVRVAPGGEAVFFKDQRAQRMSRVSLLLPRSTFQQLGGFQSAKWGADQEFALRLAADRGRALTRLRCPVMFCSWSTGSATRQTGSESLDDGFRSAPRRAYSELAFRKHVLREDLSAAQFESLLRDTDNYLEPCALDELGR